MPSWGESAARGLESGFRLALDVQEGQRRQAREDRLESRQSGLDQRAQEDRDYSRKRQKQSDDLANLDRWGSMLDAEGRAHTMIPPDEATQKRFVGRADALKQARESVLAGGANTFDGSYDDKQLATRVQALQSGDLTAFQKPGAFSKTIQQATGRSAADYLRGPNGEPAPIERGAQDLLTGMEGNDHPRAIAGANALFKQELDSGVGSPGAQGGTIVGKRIINLIPDPNSPKDDPHVVPTIRVFVNNGKAAESGDEIRTRRNLDEGVPKGATGHYDTFVTQNRSTDPADPPKPISIKAALDKVGQQQHLVELMNTPEANALLANDAKAEPWDRKRYEAVLAERGIERPKPRSESFTLKPGDIRVDRTTDLSGNVSERRTEGNDKTFRASLFEQAQDYAEQTGQPVDQVLKMMQSGGLTRQPGKYSGGAGLNSGAGGGGAGARSSGANAGGGDGLNTGGLSKEAERLVKAQQTSIKIDGERMDKGFEKEEARIERKYEADSKNVSSSKKAAAEAERAAAMKDLDGRRQAASADVTAKIEKLQDRINVTVVPDRKAAGAAPARAAAKSGPAIASLPSGAKQIGTSGGKKVFQTPDGKKFVED